MVLGIGEGSLEIVLDSTQFKPGETIKGKVKLDLKSAKKAKGLRIGFYGEIQTTHYHRGKRETQVERVHERNCDLGGEKEYSAGVSEYGFEIALPVVEARKPAGDVVGKVFDFLAPDPLTRTKWYLDASLELPLSFDINKKMQVDFRV